MPEGPFSDLLVIDCASFIAGPAAATVLGDFGARVIKIEPPGEGDSYRRLFPMMGGPEDGLDYFWTFDSRGKESLALDLKSEEGRAALEALVKRADVFITNYPPRVRRALRLAASDLRPLNPRLIYASLTPYGEEGPDSERTGYDTTAWWARSALMDMVRASPETAPGLSTPGMGDHPTAISLYGGIVTALYRRQRTGEGGEVMTSLLANGLWSNGCQVQAALCGYDLAQLYATRLRSPLAGAYRAADGRAFLLLMLNAAREWPLLARALGREAWLDDPRYEHPEARAEHAEALVGELTALFASRPWTHWDPILRDSGVTYGMMSRLVDIGDDPQIKAAGMLRAFEDGEGLRTVDSPIRIAGVEKRPPRLAPDVGQHTAAILSELGLG